MSLRIYRLLRNNKEEGPLTAEELIGKQLKTYDLIWIDGRSALWSYPGELPEFKKYAPISNEENNRHQFTAVSASVQAAVAMNNNIVSVAPQKPRYKVSAAWTKIQTASSPVLANEHPRKIKEPMVKANELKQSSLVESKSLSWEEAWLDWEKEKVFDEPAVKSTTEKKINTGHAKKAVINKAPQLEVKYAESLDSLKEKYIDNLVQQKLSSKRSSAQSKVSEFILPAAALIIIFSVGFWLLHNTDVTPKTTTPLLLHQPQSSVSSNNNTSNVQSTLIAKQEDEPSQNSLSNKDQATDRNPDISNTKNSVQPNTVIKQQINSSSVTAVQNSQQTIEKSASQIQTGNSVNIITKINPSSKITDTINNVSTNNSGTGKPAINNVTLPANTKIKTVNDYVSVPSYVAMNNGIGSINIQNVSDINLDQVVVNVQYFTASGTYHKGETLYLHNLKAGRNVIIKTPKDDTSTYAISNVSLVSSDAEKVYVVGDN